MSRLPAHSTIPGLDPGIQRTSKGAPDKIPSTEGGYPPNPIELRVAIAVETPLQDDVRELVSRLNAALLELTPREFCHHMTVEEMARPETTVFVARIDGRAVGIGALWRHGPDIAEVKRMYTRPELQGRGIGGAILAEIEALARSESIPRLVLETGDRHPAAWRVYERGGFTRCSAFLDYPDTGWSVFYEKHLGA